MSLKARDMGREWAESHLPHDLKGRLMQFASFEDDETCKFFHPSWPNTFQRMVITGASRWARKHGAKTTYKTVTIQDYDAWLGPRGDTPEMRHAFLETITTLIG